MQLYGVILGDFPCSSALFGLVKLWPLFGNVQKVMTWTSHKQGDIQEQNLPKIGACMYLVKL